MIISELEEMLKQLKKEHGDIPCVVNISHDYWGSTQQLLDEHVVFVGNAQPDGPKSGKSEKCVIFSHY